MHTATPYYCPQFPVIVHSSISGIIDYKIVRGDILTRSVQVPPPHGKVPNYVAMAIAHPQDIPAEFKDASV